MNKPSILYDSQYRLCNAEIKYYRKNDPSSVCNYLDITDEKFESEKYGLTKSDVHKYFHVVLENGDLLKGVEAFNFIWINLDKFILLQKIFKTKLGKSLMELGYKGFIFVRPYLPRKKACDEYCEL
jgi:predicted DCC family thiol-disulfide oxidoreductase YuxK